MNTTPTKAVVLLTLGAMFLFCAMTALVCGFVFLASEFDLALCIPIFFGFLAGILLTVLGAAELPEVRR